MASIRVIAEVVLPYRNGRYAPHGPGDAIPLRDLSESLVRMIEHSPERLAHVVEVS